MVPPPPPYNEMTDQNMEHLKTPGMAWNQMAAMGYEMKG